MQRNPILIICFILAIHLSAQQSDIYYPQDYSILPPSPEVSALMKYIDVPVSPFTGQPEITIPIFTITEGALEVPISLSYHGGGIKVDEQSGHIGLGWTLNAGGCVSRTVRNIPDESPYNHALHSGGSSLYSLRGLFNLNPNERALRDTILNRTGGDYALDQNLEKALPYNLCSSYDDGLCDMANDIFHFNCLNYNGTFILSDNNDPDAPISMTLSTSSPIAFTNNFGRHLTQMFELKDDLHNVFQFGQMEETRFDHNYKLGPHEYTDSIYYISAWHLTKVYNIMGDTINFSYTCSGFRHEYNGCSEIFSKSSNIDVAQNRHTTNANSIVYYPQLLTSISTKTLIVEFEYNDKDILEFIKIYRKKNEKDLIKSFILNHQTQSPHRVLLTNVDEMPHNVTSTEKPIRIYEFEYDSTLVHDYHSQDEWGYYNGANNSSLLVNYPSKNHNDRKPYLQHAKAGTLTKIKYPTGGFTQFDWELNDFYNKGVGIKNDTTETTLNTQDCRLYGKIAELNEITKTSVKTNEFDTQKFISISEGKKVSVEIDVKPFMDIIINSGSGLYINNSPYDYTHGDLDANGSAPRLELKAPNGSIIGRWYIDRHQANVLNKPTITLNEYGTGTFTFSLKYPYNWFEDMFGNDPNLITPSDIWNNLVHYPSNFNANGDMGYVLLKITEEETKKKISSNYWGGLRVSSITSFSGDPEDKAIIKTYSYIDSQENGTIKSSGCINELPNTSSIHYLATDFNGSIPGVNITQFTDEHSSGLYSTPIGNSRVEYPHVIESIGDLRIEYFYSSQSNTDYRDRIDDNSYMTDFVPAGARILTSYAPHRGNLLKKCLFSKGKKYYEETNSTSVIEGPSNITFTSDFHKILDIEVGVGNSQYSSDYATCRYHLIPYNKRIESTHSVSYSYLENLQSGNEIIQSFENDIHYSYFYDSFNANPYANLIRSKTSQASDGKTYHTFYSYLRRNGKTIALKETEVTICDGKIISSRRNQYDDHCRLIKTYKGPTGMTNLSQFMIGNNIVATEDLVNAINIPEYSYLYDNGKIVEISFNGHVLASYLWGYKGSHPIAEIKGITYSNLQSVLPDGYKPQQLNNRVDLTANDLSIIRNLFPNNDVTTITYDWLIGIGTMTNPRGVTTYFNYDDFGRLKNIKDFNGYFISKYDYHYLMQN